jgi:hypothetical protein
MRVHREARLGAHPRGGYFAIDMAYLCDADFVGSVSSVGGERVTLNGAKCR